MKHSIRLLVLVCLAGAYAQTAPVQITTGDQRDRDPAVSPDGKFLVFSSDRTGDDNIFLLDFDKQGVVQLTNSPKDDRYPSFTPDGKRILFDSKRTGNGDLYQMSVEGESGYLQLTDMPGVEESATTPPNGDGVLFARSAKASVVRRKIGGANMEICFRAGSASGGSVVALADGDEPMFSPDGSRIVFVSHRTKNQDIWMMNADGSQQMQLTTDGKDDANPCFSPDGKSIAFASDRTGNFNLYAMDADGRNVRQLTTDEADETQPVWSVGGYIYFTKTTGTTTSNIYRIPAPN